MSILGDVHAGDSAMRIHKYTHGRCSRCSRPKSPRRGGCLAALGVALPLLHIALHCCQLLDMPLGADGATDTTNLLTTLPMLLLLLLATTTAVSATTTITTTITTTATTTTTNTTHVPDHHDCHLYYSKSKSRKNKIRHDNRHN